MFKVVEHFMSINGEGRLAGQLSFFIRFAGCNLCCLYCDTKWANEKDVKYEEFTSEELISLIDNSGVDNVTLTGGEPLLQPDINELLIMVRERKNLKVEIETNGSIDISRFQIDPLIDNVSFTLDYKTGCSGMESKMYLDNYRNVRACDTVKFVVGGIEDLEDARRITDSYKLIEKGCAVYLSPCFGNIEPKDIVDYIIRRKWNGINLQLQLHKYIWDPELRGV